MESLDRMKLLMEYKFKEQANDMSADNKPHSFPTFSEYTKEYTKEADGDEDEPVELDDDGLPKQVAPEGEPPVDGDMGSEEQPVNMDEPTDSTDAVKSAFSGDDMESNIEYGEEQPETPAMGYDFDEMEAKLDYQNDKIEAILKNIEKINSFLPKPETPAEKIIKKLDSLEAEIKTIKNADSIKRDLVATKNPYNIPLKDYFVDDEDDKEEEFVITQTDIENYNPDEIKKTLGL